MHKGIHWAYLGISVTLLDSFESTPHNFAKETGNILSITLSRYNCQMLTQLKSFVTCIGLKICVVTATRL